MAEGLADCGVRLMVMIERNGLQKLDKIKDITRQSKQLEDLTRKMREYQSTLGNKRVELFDIGAGVSEPMADDNAQVASEMSNQELLQAGMHTMNETD
ncbi:hypothetical protein L2E82_45027 [Cichorium intybus]|uniref:Uncharacterized protein n=1 Tax=Cichorium intybus TaxID=13427 RepID=A0ACB8ZRR6_CICIN|nr:hypothetical protein L2E82_45027 [Cichorium intybus]